MKISSRYMTLVATGAFNFTCNSGQVFSEKNTEQLNVMLEERPLMTVYETREGPQIIDETSIMYKHAIELISDLEFPVLWSTLSPDDDAEASHYVGDHPLHASISIAELKSLRGNWEVKRRFEDLWFSYIYALYDIKLYKERRVLYERCRKMEVEKHVFIVEMAKLEHEAMASTVSFVNNAWIPWAAKVGSYSIPTAAEWTGFDPDFEKWITQYHDHEGYPWVPFGEMFEVASKQASMDNVSNRWRLLLDEAFKFKEENGEEWFKKVVTEALELKASADTKNVK